MNSTLQNRLVGTIIVVALVVIFLPEVLDGEKDTEKPAFVDIPPAPQAVIIEAPAEFPQEALDAAVDRQASIAEAVALDDEPSATESAIVESNSEELTNDLDTQRQVTQNAAPQDASPQNLVPQDIAPQNAPPQDQMRTEQALSDQINQERALAQALEEQRLQDLANDQQTGGQGWVVQLGSFRYEKNVNELIATLNQAGFKAFSRPAQTSVGKLNKVFVGPELDRERLERAMPQLQELTKLKGKITAFDVSD